MIHPQMFSVKRLIPGQAQWTSDGTYSFTVPDECYSIAAVVIGGGGGGANTGSGYSYHGGGGGGGGLSYHNSISVTPGETLTVIVGGGGRGAQSSTSDGNDGYDSSIKRSVTTLISANGGKKGKYNSGLGEGGAGGTASGGVGGVAYSGGKGATGNTGVYANGGFSGRYTEVGYNGQIGNNEQNVSKSANLTGGLGTIGTGSGGAKSNSPRDTGNSGGVRIMWGVGREFPSNAADV